MIVPATGEDLVSSVVKSALNADVVVLDWQIGKDDGATTIKVLQAINEADRNKGGRLRLAVIYTGEPQLQGCHDRLKEKLPSLSDQAGEHFVLAHEKLRIRLIKKHDGGVVGADSVHEKDLPDRVVEEFAKFAGGLLPNAVMAAICAIRENAHLLLRRFSKELDGAYLGHRILLAKPEDADAFLFDLLGDEIKSLLDDPEICEGVVDLTALREYVQEYHPADDTRRVKQSKNPGNQLQCADPSRSRL